MWKIVGFLRASLAAKNHIFNLIGVSLTKPSHALGWQGWWRKALSYQATEAMTLAWFEDQGLIPLTNRYRALQLAGNRRGT